MKKIFVLFLAVFLAAPFAEAKTPEYEAYIEEAFKSGVILGDENGDFNSEKIATRAEFAVMAVRFLKLNGGVNIFSDVSDSDWFAQSLAAASFNGMLAGYEDGRARPYDPIKCEDAVTILGRYYDAKLEIKEQIPNVSDYAAGYFAYAKEKGLFQRDEYNEPQHYVTKGEILALLYEYNRNSAEKVCFMTGYPKISDDGVFNNISVDLITNAPCTVYYSLLEAGSPAWSIDEILCVIPKGAQKVSVHRPANINMSYDLYLKPVSEDGVPGRIEIIKNIMPLPFPSGDGTKEDPYIIYTERQLAAIAQRPDKAYKIGADIVLSGSWKAIDNFSGVLDGAGYSVRGLKVKDNGTGVGMFALLDGGTVRNLAVEADISAKNNVGIIAGRNIGGIIDGCTVWGTVSAKTNNCGGICGVNNGVIKNCLSAAYSVSCDSYAGGICGQNTGKTENCLSAAETVVSQMYAGGIAGVNNGGEIVGCIAANMNVYNSMTHNSGKISTNKQNAVTINNFCYDGMVSNASYEIPSEISQSGTEVSWEELTNIRFYQSIGWRRERWKISDNGYRLACPSQAAPPEPEKGRYAYMPLPVTNAQELAAIGKNEAGHYILGGDIVLRAPWKTICGQNGFSGTFDGNGYTIYGLNLREETGMFSNITGGTIKNLTLADVSASPASSGAIITACNYGYIENCTVRGHTDTKKAGTLGIIAGENFGRISGCTVNADITNNCNNSTIGGICGENSGVVEACLYSGKISSNGENVVAGGIAGYDSGYLSENFASVNFTLKGKTVYAGGICGASSGSQIYKCASSGSIAQKGDMSYAGGICASMENGTVYNCYSALDSSVSSKLAYTGGITGCAVGSHIQNTYSCGNIIASGGNAFAAGICGYAESSFIMQNVSLNPSVTSSGKAAMIVSEQSISELSDNYSCDRTVLKYKVSPESADNGTVKRLQNLKNTDFYFKPVAQGGMLGWENDKNGYDVWTKGKNNLRYEFPVLSDVKGQENVLTPNYR